MLDDYSRFVLASDLKPDMTAHSISDVVEQAVAFTGIRQVPIEDRTQLLGDHGSGYLARVFEEYLRMLAIRHIYCAPHHPQTNGKIERFHETLKARMNLLVYTSPDELRRTMQDFIEYYNHRRYHEAIGNVPRRMSTTDGGKKSYAEGPNRNNARLSSGCVTIWAAGTRNQGWN